MKILNHLKRIIVIGAIIYGVYIIIFFNCLCFRKFVTAHWVLNGALLAIVYFSVIIIVDFINKHIQLKNVEKLPITGEQIQQLRKEYTQRFNIFKTQQEENHEKT